MNAKLAEFIAKCLPLGSMGSVAKAVKTFFKRIVLLPQAEDRENIENMKQFLSAAADVLEELEKNGVSEKERREMAKDLYMPLVAAVRDALILRQKVSGEDETHITVQKETTLIISAGTSPEKDFTGKLEKPDVLVKLAPPSIPPSGQLPPPDLPEK